MKLTMAVTSMCLIMISLVGCGSPLSNTDTPPLSEAADSGADDAAAKHHLCTEIAQHWIEFWNGGDIGTALDVFTEEIVYEDVPTAVVVRGAEEFRPFAQGFFDAIPDVKLELVSSSCNDNKGFIEWVMSGTDVGFYRSGNRFSVRGVSVIEIEGKRISRNLDYWDLATLLRQVGLLPPGL